MFCNKISSLVDTPFSEWLLKQMSEKNWSQADLSRASGLNRQVISSYINMRRTNPEPDALVALAHGLKISPITVFRAAGILPTNGNGDQVKLEDWQYLLSQMTADEQEEIRQIIEMKIERRQKAEQAERARNFKPKKTVK